MRIFILAVGLAAFCFACEPEPKSVNVDKPEADLNLLVDYMSGYYTSEAQSRRDTNYLNIMLAMEPIWKDRSDGAWLYVEQAASWTPKQPYRQRFYHLEQLSDTSFTSTIYQLKNDSLYVGGHRDPAVFDAISPDSLELLEGCALTLHFADSVFTGSTNGRNCINAWGAATYATSEATVYPDSLISWDRGYNDTGEQVWGAEKGGYHFVKLDSGM